MAKQASLNLEWKDLTYQIPSIEDNMFTSWCTYPRRPQQQLKLLKNVSGHIKSGDLVAILGCSGAGKTTLLTAISQRIRGNLTGDIRVNGLKMESKDMIRISGFLPQQFDIHMYAFTPYEHLYFMSHFKMDCNTTIIEKRQRVNDVILAVGLTDIAHTRLQYLSGGERKRLSLAEELIMNPPFLFCDEPTTGLDSYSAYRMIKILHSLCNDTSSSLHYDGIPSIGRNDCTKDNNHNRNNDGEMEPINNLCKNFSNCYNKAVLCAIHQPTSNIYKLFTHIILMERGEIIYHGRSNEAEQFFTRIDLPVPLNCNPPDFYLKTISDGHAAFIQFKYDSQIMGFYTDSWLKKVTSHTRNYPKANDNFEKIWWPYQVYLLFLILITEKLRNLKQNCTGLGLLLLTSVMLSGIYGNVSNFDQTSIQNMNGSIFMLSNEIIFTFSYGVVYVFPSKLPAMRRNVGEGIYSLSAFYVAVALSQVPLTFCATCLFFTIFYSIIYHHLGFWLYLKMIIVLNLSALAATSYGFFLSSLFETEKMSTECAAPFDLIFLIFSGAYYNVDTIPYIKYLSLFFYANEALMYTFWIDVDQIVCLNNTDQLCLQNGKDVLIYNSYRTAINTYWFDATALVLNTFLFHIFAYIFVRKYVRRSGYY